jgi:quercetin dioxygenase-like cupin family protein
VRILCGNREWSLRTQAPPPTFSKIWYLKAKMPHTDLLATAAALTGAWKSTVVGTPAGVNFKVLRMDGAAYPNETHDFDEALLVLDGQMNLDINGEVIAVRRGELFLVPANVPHAVSAGSHGTLVIVDR